MASPSRRRQAVLLSPQQQEVKERRERALAAALRRRNENNNGHPQNNNKNSNNSEQQTQQQKTNAQTAEKKQQPPLVRTQNSSNNNNNKNWICPRCTLENSPQAIVCAACDFDGGAMKQQQQPPPPKQLPSVDANDDDDKDDDFNNNNHCQWACSACTLLNDSTRVTCSVCGTARKQHGLGGGAAAAASSNNNNHNASSLLDALSSFVPTANLAFGGGGAVLDNGLSALPNERFANDVLGALSFPNTTRRRPAADLVASSLPVPNNNKKRRHSTLMSSSLTTTTGTTSSATIADRIGFGGWIRWGSPGNDQETLEEWLEAVKPSQIPNMMCHWISVDNPNKNHRTRGLSTETTFEDYKDVLNPIQEKIDNGQKIMQAEKLACVAAMAKIATAKGDTSGKWVIRTSSDKADEIWEKVAHATVAGQLGCSAKIMPAGSQQHGIIGCVYVQDFNCRSQVKRVLTKLIELEIANKVTSFKPDFMTTLGINSGNQWRLYPRLYTKEEVLEW